MAGGSVWPWGCRGNGTYGRWMSSGLPTHLHVECLETGGPGWGLALLSRGAATRPEGQPHGQEVPLLPRTQSRVGQDIFKIFYVEVNTCKSRRA